MALTANEIEWGSDNKIADTSGRLIVVGPDPAATGANPLVVDPASATTGAPEAAVSVTTTATLVQAASARKEARFQPTNGDIFWGTDNTVTAATGIKVASGAVWVEDRWKGTIYAIAAGTVDVRRQELV